MRARYALAAVAAVTIGASAPALAFDTRALGYGSLFVGDFTALINSSPKLRQEVHDALAAAHKTAEEQECEAPRFPGPWKNLHGEHVAPFTCNIGGRWLQINATVRVTGPKGEAYETQSDAAMKRASRVSQTNPTWTWTDDDPRKSK
jgi:hypothetical protein